MEDLRRPADDVVRELGGAAPPIATLRARVRARRRVRTGLAGIAAGVALCGAVVAAFDDSSAGEADQVDSSGVPTQPSPAPTSTPDAVAIVDPDCTTPLPPAEINGITATLTMARTVRPSDWIAGGIVVVHNPASEPFPVYHGGGGLRAHVVTDGLVASHRLGQEPASLAVVTVPANGSSEPIAAALGLVPCESTSPGGRIPPGTYEVRAVLTLPSGDRLSTSAATVTVEN